MNTDKPRFLVIFFLLVFSVSISAQTFKIEDYYQLADSNEWRYTAPPNWKDGDYVSQMKAGELLKLNGKTVYTVKHFDATKAAKVLAYVKGKGLYYLREEFANNDGYAEFDTPVLWFPEKLKLGQKTEIDTGFTRYFKDGKTGRGTYKLTQTIVKLEDMKVSAGEFKNALRVESESYWNLGDGREAKTVNIYHYVKNVGVIKASARFIILKDGKETINRLVETDMKSYKAQ